MTTIVRATGTITSPPVGSFVYPEIGVPGVVSQFSARELLGASGAAVALLHDGVGGHDMALNTGGATILDVSGKRLLDLYDGTNTVRFASTAFSGVGLDRTLVLSARFLGNPSATERAFSTLELAPGSINMSSGGLFQAYGSSSGFNSGAISKPVSAVVIATLDDAGVAKIAVNGTITTGAITYSSSASSLLAIRATVAQRYQVADVALISGILTDAQIATVTAALQPYLP